MANLKKGLFVPSVPLEELNPHVKSLVDAPSYHPTRNMLDLIYQDFDDPDGNFLQQFQTTGFDARFYELYLFAYFSNSGFEVDRTHPSPDFIVTRDGVTVAVEATTVNPSQGNLFVGQSLPSRLDPRELAHFQNEELPIRFGSPLFSKLKNRYWDLEHCKGRPFILAIQAFFNEESLTLADSSLTQYLYGQRMSAGWTPEGNLVVNTDVVESHTYGAKNILSNFFEQPDTEYVSAVVFANSGTHAKFTRMGYQEGFGVEHFDISRSGYCYNPDSDAMDPTYFEYSLAEPPLVESWGQGLVVNHNPNALFPLPRGYFPEALEGYIEDGEYKTEVPYWHPFSSSTRIIQFANPPNRLPRVPRVHVAAITKSDFEGVCGFAVHDSNPLLTEEGCFMDETESFLGVVVQDKADQDWGYVILARDEHFQFRAIKAASSKTSRLIARRELQFAVSNLVAGAQRIFRQG